MECAGESVDVPKECWIGPEISTEFSIGLIRSEAFTEQCHDSLAVQGKTRSAVSSSRHDGMLQLETSHAYPSPARCVLRSFKGSTDLCWLSLIRQFPSGVPCELHLWSKTVCSQKSKEFKRPVIKAMIR